MIYCLGTEWLTMSCDRVRVQVVKIPPDQFNFHCYPVSVLLRLYSSGDIFESRNMCPVRLLCGASIYLGIIATRTFRLSGRQPRYSRIRPCRQMKHPGRSSYAYSVESTACPLDGFLCYLNETIHRKAFNPAGSPCSSPFFTSLQLSPWLRKRPPWSTSQRAPSTLMQSLPPIVFPRWVWISYCLASCILMDGVQVSPCRAQSLRA